jgi:dTDP-glucose 4,6-dehydratase/UDP-glucose 4-epimerase
MDLTSIQYDIKEDVALAIARSGADLSSLRGKKILVTGGTGFFGIWMLTALGIVRKALNGELDITVISRDSRSFLERQSKVNSYSVFHFVDGDIRSIHLEGKRFTHLVHMATTSANETFSKERQVNKIDLLYCGTKNLLQQIGSDLEAVLFTSSGVVYGAPLVGTLIEEHQLTRPDSLNPDSALGYGKLLAEYLVSYFSVECGFKYNIARCFSFLGQGLPLNIHYAAGNFVADAINNRPIRVLGSGQEYRSYMYIGDALAWLLRLLVEPTNDVYNLGSEKAMTVLDLAKAVAAVAERPGQVEVLGRSLLEGNFKRQFYAPSTSKIRSRFPGLLEWTPVTEAVGKMLRSDGNVD